MLIEASTTARTAPKDFAAGSRDSMGSAEACETGSAGGLGGPVPTDEPGPEAGVPDPGVPGPGESRLAGPAEDPGPAAGVPDPGGPSVAAGSRPPAAKPARPGRPAPVAASASAPTA